MQVGRRHHALANRIGYLGEPRGLDFQHQFVVHLHDDLRAGARLTQPVDRDHRALDDVRSRALHGRIDRGAFGLAAQLGIPRGTAQEYIDLYFARYPGVKRYMEETRASARERGYVETVFGRRLYLPDINARNKQFAQAAERAAINAPMQGTAADIIKRAMVAVDAWLEGGARTHALMLMQVHDELVFEADADFVDPLLAAVRERMEAAAELRVPLVVDVGVGTNWDEAH